MAAPESLSEPRLGSNSDWAELTRECLTNILSRLSLEDRWRGAMLVCKAWLDACRDPMLLSAVDLEPFFCSAPAESPLWWTLQFQAKIDAMLGSVAAWAAGSLTQIRVRHCSHRSLSSVADMCPNLRILAIKSCMNVTDASLTKVAANCPMLRELDISYCNEISHESLAFIGKNCPNLKTLKRNSMNWLDPSQHVGIIPDEYLKSCPQDGDLEASAIGKYMPNLEHLELQYSKISVNGLMLVTEGCLNLEHLDLSCCANLTSRDIWKATSGLKNLKKVVKPNFHIPRSVFHTERYGHWRLYDDRFQTDVFRI